MKSISFLLTAFIFINCSPKEPAFKSLPEGVETISLLGDTLRTNSSMLPQALAERIDSLVLSARAKNLESDAVIWEARYLGYNGFYQRAVDLLSKRIQKDPENPELYRHRGHRYITLRAFDLAIKDFEQAAELIRGKEDVVEQDGLPNALNKPTSTLHTNIWYHLGLAYYLTDDFEKAQKAYEECINASTNDDMLVATVYWYYMTLRRNGQDEFAGKIIEPIETEMDIIENDSYHKLLLVFKGEFTEEMLLDQNADELTNSTIGYGIGNWHYINGRTERAKSIWRDVYDGDNYASFGFIAAESELASK